MHKLKLNCINHPSTQYNFVISLNKKFLHLMFFHMLEIGVVHPIQVKVGLFG